MPKEICPMNGLKFPLKETSEGDFLNAEEPTTCNCDKIYHTDSSKDPQNKKNNCRRLSYTRAEFQVDWWQMITVQPKGSPQILTAKGSHPTKENLNKILPKEICPTIKPKFLSHVSAAKGDLPHVKSSITRWNSG
jgi:hypothetical protein